MWAEREFSEMRKLLAQGTVIASTALLVIGAVVILLREPLLRIFGGPEGPTAAIVLLFGVLGQIVNGGLFWNIPLLYSAKRARSVSKLYLMNVVVLVPLLVGLTYVWGANGAACSLMLSTLLMNGMLTVACLKLLNDAGAPHMTHPHARDGSTRVPISPIAPVDR
jgi:Na+-driven multidrug efflux pump